MQKIKRSSGHSGNPVIVLPVFTGMIRLTFLLLFLASAALAQDTWKNVYSEASWADRDRWQKPQELIRQLRLPAGGRVADIGCHEGYMTMKLAQTVGPTGKVYAVDINPDKLERLNQNAEERGLKNIEAVLGSEDNPKLPVNELDGVIIVDSYHEMDYHDRILGSIYAALKPGGRLVFCEPLAEERKGASRADQERKHELGIAFALEDAQRAGFTLVYRADPFLDRTAEKGDMMWLLVMKK